MADATACPYCRQSIAPDDLFCPHCGKKLEGGGLPAAKKKAPMKTMVSFSSPVASGSAPATPAADPQPADPAPAPKPAEGGAGKVQMKTMMGLSPADQQKVQAAVAQASAHRDAGQAPPSPKDVAGAEMPPEQRKPNLPKSTMLGLPAAELANQPLPASSKRPPASAAPGPDHFGRTLPSPVPPPGPTGGGAGDAALPAPAPTPGKPSIGGGRTMLGAPGVQLPTQGGAQLGGGRTMLGGPSAAPASIPGAIPAGTPHPPAPEATRPISEPAPGPDVPAPRAAGGGGKLGMLLAAAGVALGAAALAMLASGGGPEVQAKIVSIDSGEAILFEVPQAAAGSKIAFGEQEKLLKGGSATFPLGSDALKVGDNVVLAKIVDPDGDAEDVRITLAVEYRIHVDTGPLEAGKSELDVVISALPGTEVQLDGEALKLDAEGRAVQPYPLDLSAVKDGFIEHRVKYRIQPPSGEAVVDELVTRVKVTSLTIDKPGQALVTDAASVEIAGAVKKGTKVSIDGKAVPVAEGRFLLAYPLSEVGKYEPIVEATLAGHAPQRVKLSIERVDDLAQAAAAYEVNADISYEKLSQNPAMYKGQRAAFEGRVFNVMVADGKAALQMLVRDCPNNCSLWVDYPAGLEVHKNDWVRVLGSIEGVQQFRSAKNEVGEVPKLHAAFVVAAEP